MPAFLTPALDDFWGNQIAEKAKQKVLAYFAIATVIVGVFSFLYGKEAINSSVKSEIKSVIDSKSADIDKQIDDLMKPQRARIDALEKQADDLTSELAKLKQSAETQVNDLSTWIVGKEGTISQYAIAHSTEGPARPAVVQTTVDLSGTIGQIIDSGESNAGEAAAPIYAVQSELSVIGQLTPLSYAGAFYFAGGSDAGVNLNDVFSYMRNIGIYKATDWPPGIKTKPANILPFVKITDLTPAMCLMGMTSSKN